MRDGRRKSTFYTTSNHLPGLLPMASGSKGHIFENVSSCTWAELSGAAAAKSTRGPQIPKARHHQSKAQPSTLDTSSLTVAATPSGFGGAQQRRAAAGIPSLRVEYRVPQCRAAAHSHRLMGPRRCLEVLFYSQVLTHRKLDSIYFGSFRNVKYFLVDL